MQMQRPPSLPAGLYGDAADLIRACLDPTPTGRPPAFRLLALPFLARPPTRAEAAAASRMEAAAAAVAATEAAAAAAAAGLSEGAWPEPESESSAASSNPGAAAAGQMPEAASSREEGSGGSGTFPPLRHAAPAPHSPGAGDSGSPSDASKVTVAEEGKAAARRATHAAAEGGGGKQREMEREMEREVETAFLKQWSPCGTGGSAAFGSALLLLVGPHIFSLRCLILSNRVFVSCQPLPNVPLQLFSTFNTHMIHHHHYQPFPIFISLPPSHAAWYPSSFAQSRAFAGSNMGGRRVLGSHGSSQHVGGRQGRLKI